ncbi:MAG: DegT/DnrJ/EryC1/StrS aminotransferase family protein [Solirubrobacterales bacterium]
MRDEFLTFGKPLIGQEEIDEVVASLRSGWVGTGPNVARLERMLEAYLGAKHVRCVSSCTAALCLSMKALDIGPGDEVIVPAMTFVASANAIENIGARPVLVDSDSETGLIDLDAAAQAITERTKAIMPVHLAGRPVDLDRLADLTDRNGLHVIEDAAHAIGAEWGGRKIGAHGNVAAFSFYVTKNITTIEGGAIATDDLAIAEQVERLALHGLSTDAWRRFSDAGFRHYEVVQPGFKFNMTDVQAAIGIHQLPKLDSWIEQRAAMSVRYDRLLRHLPVATPPPPANAMRHAHHLYQVQVGDDARLSRDHVLDRLHSDKIGVGVHYRGVHLHPYYRDRYEIAPESLPVATDISNRTLSLPLSPLVDWRDQDDVVQSLTAALT